MNHAISLPNNTIKAIDTGNSSLYKTDLCAYRKKDQLPSETLFFATYPMLTLIISNIRILVMYNINN